MNSSPLKLRQRGTPVDSRHLGEMMAMFPPAPVQPGGVANHPHPGRPLPRPREIPPLESLSFGLNVVSGHE